jgi:hypothetical protein
MARPTRATQAKRSRERAKQEKQKEKRAEREVRKEQKVLKEPGKTGSSWEDDPDLAGIVPGPQPIQEF